MGGSRPQASKLAINRARLPLTLARAGKATDPTAAASPAEEERWGEEVCLQNDKDCLCRALNDHHRLAGADLTAPWCPKPSEEPLGNIGVTPPPAPVSPLSASL